MATSEQPQPTSRLIMLGTGTPNCESQRAGSALAIVVNDQPYLVDAGPNVVRRAAAAQIPLAKLDHLFMTHLHSDHTIGYPDFILSPAVLGRNHPLQAFGPPGLQNMTDHLLAAYAEDILERTRGLERGNPDAYQVDVHEFDLDETGAHLVFQDENIKVEAFRVKHGTWPHAYGYRFETADGRSMVISGDTVPHPNLIEQARDCDILVHEVYSHAAFQRRPSHWQEYHRNAHTSSRELAKIANEVRPKLLILTHSLLWETTREELLAEIALEYDGTVILADDLDCF